LYCSCSLSKTKVPLRRNKKIYSLICFSQSKIDEKEEKKDNFIILFPNKKKKIGIIFYNFITSEGNSGIILDINISNVIFN